MKPSTRSLRKAAILVASLDAEQADVLLGQMSPEQAQLLRDHVARLGPVDPAEQSDVLDEFFRIGPLVPEADPAGIELDAPLPSSINTMSHQADAAASAAEGKVPFRCLEEAPPERLAPFLAGEQPQTIAVVLSHLAADRAAAVLAHLPAELQTDVARRLFDLEETDAEVLSAVEQGLESWLCAQVRGERNKSAGLAALAGILGAADPRSRHDLLANLARHDRELADKLDLPAPPALSFADLARFDSRSLAAVLNEAQDELLVLALAGAPPRLAERASALLSPARAGAVSEALCSLGPTRLSDVEEAQRQLAELARGLHMRGQIAPEVLGRLSVAV